MFFQNPGPRQSFVSPAYSNDSSIMTSSTATEKSVRFSDRDYILSTPGHYIVFNINNSINSVHSINSINGVLMAFSFPLYKIINILLFIEPRMTGSTQCSAPILHQRTNISTSNSSSSMGHLQHDRMELLPIKVKSILKSEQNTPTYSKKYTEGM